MFMAKFPTSGLFATKATPAPSTSRVSITVYCPLRNKPISLIVPLPSAIMMFQELDGGVKKGMVKCQTLVFSYMPQHLNAS
jgi:hypothetical protein